MDNMDFKGLLPVDKVILASNSPRRLELLKMVGFDVEVIPASCNEETSAVDPSRYCMELSERKALSVSMEHPSKVVVGADTIVVLNGDILGKPKDYDDAFKMLTMLSGNTHEVFTGVTVSYNRKNLSFFERTEVTMHKNSRELIQAYLDTKEPFDKAGSYGIQGIGAILVKEIQGDYFNVMGLPISSLVRKIKMILNEKD